LDSLEVHRQGCSPQVGEAIEVITTQYATLQSVREVARKVGCNYHTLRSRFRRETRMTLEQCLIRTRLLHAARLLVESDLLVKEIAWEVGFRYEHQLTRSMKKWLGATPQVLRRLSRVSRLVAAGLSRARGLSGSN